MNLTLDTIRRYSTLTPKLGMVLGSGLGKLADAIEQAVRIPYAELEGFPQPTVKGHGGEFILGTLNGCPVACLSGRHHLYENFDYQPVRHYVRTLKALGCTDFLATNAAGSLRQDLAPGQLLLINDHINFQPGNPLVGPNDDAIGPRFLDVTSAYAPEHRERLQRLAKSFQIQLPEGVYIAVLGPSYETAAEIRAFKLWGADVVGMSTVPEVLLAHHAGMKIAVISMVTNYATGISKTHHDHQAVVNVAQQSSEQLIQLITAFAGDLMTS